MLCKGTLKGFFFLLHAELVEGMRNQGKIPEWLIGEVTYLSIFRSVEKT